MSLTDLQYNEVRIRQGEHFQQIPNFIIATEALVDGQFVYLDSSGGYSKASSSNAATHFVKRSGEKRHSIEEINTLIGTVQAGEPVMAITGQGTVTIPFASNVNVGDQLVVSNGYAVKYTAGADYIIGQALEDVVIADGETVEWGDALINLPATYKAA